MMILLSIKACIFILQRAALINGMPLHARMVCTGFVWVDRLRGVFGVYGRDRGDVTNNFEPFIQLFDWFGDGGVLFGRSTVEVRSWSREVLVGRR